MYTKQMNDPKKEYNMSSNIIICRNFRQAKCMFNANTGRNQGVQICSETEEQFFSV